MGQKRRRLALSCVDCRRRKVKCDRTYPSCIRCQKGGYGDKCVYVPHTGPDAGLPTPEDERRRHSRSESAATWQEEAQQYEDAARNNERASAHIPSSHAPMTGLPSSTHDTRRIAYQPSSGLPQPAADHRIAQLHGRIMELETLVYAAGGKPTSREMNLGLLNPMGPGAHGDRNYYSDTYTAAEHDKALLRGQSFKTQYFGPSSTLAILLQFEDLSKFVKEILLALPSLSNAKYAMSKLRANEKEAAKQPYNVSIESLVNMVPEREYADKLLYHYLDTIETSLRIIHVPTFLKDYEAYWQSPKDAKPEFVVQLLVSMSMMCCIAPGGEEGFVGRSSARREMASHWINVAVYWLDIQSQKHVALVNYQLRVQIWLSKAINTIKVKRFWTDSGALVRWYMSAGLHRDPGVLSGKVNVFDCEMRRRLWYTVLELDLQSTIDRGFTPTIGPMDWDTNPPLNIDDEDFDMDSESLPEPKPRGTFTRSSYLAWAAESLPLRLEMISRINSIRNALDHDTIMAYDMKLRQSYDDIPIIGWREAAARTEEMSDTSPTSIGTASTHVERSSHLGKKPTSLIAITLAQNIFNEFFVILHQPFPTEASFKSTHFHSRISRRYACIATIRMLHPPIGIESVHSIPKSAYYLDEVQRRFFAFFRDDYIRAALSLAHSYVVATTPRQDRWLLHVGDDHSIIVLIEAVVAMIGDRVLNLGQGFHGYWITSSALSFVHSKQSPDVPRNAFARAAADRVIALHSEVMDKQLPRAKRMLLPTGDPLAPMPATSLHNDPFVPIQRTGSQKNTPAANAEYVSSVDGAIDLVRSASPATVQQAMNNFYHPGSIAGPSGQTNVNVGGGAAMTFDGGMGPWGGADPMQDMFAGLENMDWDQIMNTDPMAFMMGGMDYPS